MMQDVYLIMSDNGSRTKVSAVKGAYLDVWVWF